MVSLPTFLDRGAVISTFTEISPVAWEKLFEREDSNGIGKLRVPGDFPRRAYYSTEGLIHWLVRNHRYTWEQVQELFGTTSKAPAQGIRTHFLQPA